MLHLGNHLEPILLQVNIMELSRPDWFPDSSLELQAVPEHRRRQALYAHGRSLEAAIASHDVVGGVFDDARTGKHPPKLVCTCIPRADWRCPQAVSQIVFPVY